MHGSGKLHHRRSGRAVLRYVTPDEFPEIIAATGAMLAGRWTYEVGKRDAGKTNGEAHGGAWSGPQFVLTHEPPGIRWTRPRDVLAVHPRDDERNPETGVFSTRSQDRPNPIGLHRVRIAAIEGLRVLVRDLEAFDGPPIVDIKPVLPGGR
jgi:tRNA-methyltransferase O